VFIGRQRPLEARVCTPAVAAYVVAVLNVPFGQQLVRAVRPNTAYEYAFVAGIFLAFFLITHLVVQVFSRPYLLKTFVAVVLPMSAAATYFMSEYGLPINTGLAIAALETDKAEARDLITLKLLAYVAGLGVLPALVFARLPMTWPDWRSEIWPKSKVLVASLIAIGAIAGLFFKNVTSVFREQQHIVQYFTPYNVLNASVGALRRKAAGTIAAHAVAPFGEDAKPAGALTRAGMRSLTVLVIGETARADHFTLNGYARDTTPGLSKVNGLLNFTNVEACGTLTADSLPCIFSGVGRAGTSRDIAARQENLLDILKRAGLDVMWRDNQSGCKGVCARVTTESTLEAGDPAYCSTGECHDEILLRDLKSRLQNLKGHAVMVLHMMGSHGPAYSKRYPKSFEAFSPACETSQFSRCTREAIVNAYDNTIRYTDHVLHRLIQDLESGDASGVPTAMFYVSDHGESLGENNVYLHGMPFLFAPKAQTHVPMVMWLSGGFKKQFGIDAHCLTAKRDAAIKHDHFFHTVLGLLDVSTKVREDRLNLIADCRHD
jgi:lipid A ethanolaminephosphotransferase